MSDLDDLASSLIEGTCPFCRGAKYLRGGYECPKCGATGTDGGPEKAHRPAHGEQYGIHTPAEFRPILIKSKLQYAGPSSIGAADKWVPIDDNIKDIAVDVYADHSWGIYDPSSARRGRYLGLGDGHEELGKKLSP